MPKAGPNFSLRTGSGKISSRERKTNHWVREPSGWPSLKNYRVHSGNVESSRVITRQIRSSKRKRTVPLRARRSSRSFGSNTMSLCPSWCTVVFIATFMWKLMRVGSSGSVRSVSIISSSKRMRRRSLILRYSKRGPTQSTASSGGAHPISRTTRRDGWSWSLLPRGTSLGSVHQRTGSSSRSWRVSVPNASSLRDWGVRTVILRTVWSGTRGAGNKAVTCPSLSTRRSWRIKRKSLSLAENRPRPSRPRRSAKSLMMIRTFSVISWSGTWVRSGANSPGPIWTTEWSGYCRGWLSSSSSRQPWILISSRTGMRRWRGTRSVPGIFGGRTLLR